MAVPKLRFKEFDNDWNEVKTGDIFDNVADKGYTDKTVLTIVQGKGTVPRAESGRNMIFDEASISGYKRVMQDDFIIHLRSFEGGLEKANEEGVISPAYTVLRPKNKVATQFLYDYFHTNKFINGVLTKAVEGIRDGRQISYNMFKWLKIPFPSYEEQKKIADFLTTFDKRITAQQNIVADMEEIKKGLLQKIFNQEIRFKDDNGKSYPEWEKKKIKDVCFINPKSEPLSDVFIYIDLESVDKGILTVKAPISINNAPSRAQRVLKSNDVLFQTVRPYQMGHFYFINKFDLQVVASTGFAQLRSKVGFCNEFLYHLLYTQEFNDNVNIRCTGTSYPAINSSDLSDIYIKTPCLEEQNKIASFLSTYDKKIEAEKKILADLQEIKKGLLQQIFV